MSQQTNHFLANLGKFLLYVLFGLPVMGICYVLICLYACIYLCYDKLREFFVDLWRQCTDPGYYRIGWIDAMGRNRMLEFANAAKQKGDWKSAISHWRDAAGLFSDQAMFALGECYEKGLGVDRDLAYAYECYALAERYHYGPEATEKCQRLQAYALAPKERKEFHKTIWQRRKS